MKRMDQVSDRILVTFSEKREIARRLQLIEGRKRHFYRSIKKGGLTRDRLFKSIFRITCRMVQLARRTLPKTSVSSEIEFCGIAPSFTAQNLHQIPSSSAIERNDSMATLYRRRRGGSGSFARFSLFVTDWFDSRTVRATGPLDLPEIRSGGIPKIQTAVGAIRAMRPTGSDRSSAAAFLAAIKSSLDSEDQRQPGVQRNKCSTRTAVRDAVSTVVTKAE